MTKKTKREKPSLTRSITPNTNIFECDISVRLWNLIWANYRFLGLEGKLRLHDAGGPEILIKEFSKVSKITLATLRNFGEKTIAELEKICSVAGVFFNE